jgi:hypothetical protein
LDRGQLLLAPFPYSDLRGLQAGLRQPSVVRCGRLLVIEHRLLSTGLGQLSEPDLAAVDAGLKLALGLP